MSTITVLFILWVAFFAYRGYARGFWHIFFGLFGLCAAYVATFLWGADFARFFTSKGVALPLGLFLGYSGVFLSVYLFATLVPKLLLVRLFDSPAPLPWVGATLNAGAGVVTGLALVWGLTAIKESLPEDVLASVEYFPGTKNWAMGVYDPIPHFSARFMSTVLSRGASIGGQHPVQVDLIKHLSQDPERLARSVTGLKASPVVGDFVNDFEAQALLATQDIEGLMENEKYRALVSDDNVQALFDLALVGEKNLITQESKERFVAQKMSQAWQKIEKLKNDPQVIALLDDKEVKGVLHSQQNPAIILLNPKIQQLLARVLNTDLHNEIVVAKVATEQPEEISEVSGEAMMADVTVGSLESDVTTVHERRTELIPIYQWVDEEGRLQLTQRENIPSHLLHTATEVNAY